MEPYSYGYGSIRGSSGQLSIRVGRIPYLDMADEEFHYPIVPPHPWGRVGRALLYIGAGPYRYYSRWSD